MSNILNEPPSDALEDKFFELLATSTFFTIENIHECMIEAYLFCGGELGDENLKYAKMLVHEHDGIIKYDDGTYKWKE